MENIANISTSVLFTIGFLLGVSTTIAVIATKAWRDASDRLDDANFRIRRLSDRKEGN